MNADIRHALKMDASGDPWGDTWGAWFALAGTLTLRGEDVPAAWRYRPSPLLSEDNERADSTLAGNLLDAFDAGDVTGDDLRHAGNVLMRYSDILKAQGKDY